MAPAARSVREKGGIDPRTQPNQNLARGLLILEAFTPEQPEWGVRDLARTLKANTTTTHRLLTTLENLGYLQQNPVTQRYRLGARIMRIASIYAEHNTLPVVGRQVFDEFSQRFEHSFYLGVLNQFDVVYVAVLDGRSALKISVQPGGRTALYSTGMGKVLLAYQDDAFIEAFLSAVPLKAHTERTITSPRRLWAEVHEIRRLGYAVNHAEHFEEIGAVAVPVRDANDRVIAGLALGFPIHLLNSGRLDVASLRALAQEAADAITWRLEGRLP